MVNPLPCSGQGAWMGSGEPFIAVAGGDLGPGGLEVATSVLLCPYKSLPHSGIHASSSVNWKELIIHSFSFCDLYRYSSEQNIVPALEELRVWRARQGNKREQYGPSVHPLNKFTEYLLCSKNYSSAGDLVVRKTDKNHCPHGAYSPVRERETIRK